WQSEGRSSTSLAESRRFAQDARHHPAQQAALLPEALALVAISGSLCHRGCGGCRSGVLGANQGPERAVSGLADHSSDGSSGPRGGRAPRNGRPADGGSRREGKLGPLSKGWNRVSLKEHLVRITLLMTAALGILTWLA